MIIEWLLCIPCCGLIPSTASTYQILSAFMLNIKQPAHHEVLEQQEKEVTPRSDPERVLKQENGLG